MKFVEYIRNADWKKIVKLFVSAYLISILLWVVYFYVLIVRDAGLVKGTKTLLKSLPTEFFPMMFSFWMQTFLLVPTALLLLIYGLIRFFRSKEADNKSKSLMIAIMIAFIAVISFQWRMISDSSKYPTILPDFSYFEYGDYYINAKGAWLADSKLAFPINAVEITCDRNKGIAREISAQLEFFSGGMPILAIDTREWKIKSWSDKEITFFEDTVPLSVIYRLHIDRKNKLITLVRVTKENPPKLMGKDTVQKEPIFMRLGEVKYNIMNKDGQVFK
jgi:hypothetical protein